MGQIFNDGLNYDKGFVFLANQPLDLRLIHDRQPTDATVPLPYNGLQVYVTGIYDGVLHEDEVGTWMYIQDSGYLEPNASLLYSGKWFHILDKDGNPIGHTVITETKEDGSIVTNIINTTIINNEGKIDNTLLPDLSNIDINYHSAEDSTTPAVNIGGISNMTASDFEGKTLSEVFDLLLFPESQISFTNPSITINCTSARLVLVGTGLYTKDNFSYSTDRGLCAYALVDGIKTTNAPYAGTAPTKDECVWTVDGQTLEDASIFNSTSATGQTYTFKATGTFDSNPSVIPCTNKGTPGTSYSESEVFGTTTVTAYFPYYIGVISDRSSLSQDNLESNLLESYFYTSKNSVKRASFTMGKSGYSFIAAPENTGVNFKLLGAINTDFEHVSVEFNFLGVMRSYDVFIATKTASSGSIFEIE